MMDLGAAEARAVYRGLSRCWLESDGGRME